MMEFGCQKHEGLLAVRGAAQHWRSSSELTQDSLKGIVGTDTAQVLGWEPVIRGFPFAFIHNSILP